MSIKAYSWFVLIVSGILALLICIGAFQDEDYSYMHDYFGLPK